MKLLITGGTGSLGQAFIRYTLEQRTEPIEVIVYSRNADTQKELLLRYPQVKAIVGDIRSIEQLKAAFEGVDTVVHTAALTNAIQGETECSEYIASNIIAIEHIIQAAKECGVKKVIGISSEKASTPSSVYAATKLIGERLLLSQNSDTTLFSAIRFGNIFGAKGTVVPLFHQIATGGVFNVTAKEMSRFAITFDQAAETIWTTIDLSVGGELIVPKMVGYRIVDLARAIAPNATINITGTRPGERLYEDLFSDIERSVMLDAGKFFVYPSSRYPKKRFEKIYGTHYIPETEYRSSSDPTFQASVEQLRKMYNDWKSYVGI